MKPEWWLWKFHPLESVSNCISSFFSSLHFRSHYINLSISSTLLSYVWSLSLSYYYFISFFLKYLLHIPSNTFYFVPFLCSGIPTLSLFKKLLLNHGLWREGHHKNSLWRIARFHFMIIWHSCISTLSLTQLHFYIISLLKFWILHKWHKKLHLEIEW